MFAFNPLTGRLDLVSDPFFEPFTFVANCQVTDSVNQCVYVSGESVGGVPQVARVDVTDPLKMPAIGIIIAKSGAVDCVVAYFGCITLPGLSPNARYFVDTTGLVTASVPASRPFMLQTIGQAVDSTRLLLTPSRDMVRLI